MRMVRVVVEVYAGDRGAADVIRRSDRVPEMRQRGMQVGELHHRNI